MRTAVFSAAIAALVPLNALAAAVPTSKTLEVVEEKNLGDGIVFKVYSINETRSADTTASVEKRDWCNTGADFSSSDADNLKSWLQNSSPDYLQYVGSRMVVSWESGTAKICISNNYFFDNTHVKRWEAGWATGTIKGNCCGGSSCNGGQTTCHGDSGLALSAQFMHTARDCPT